MSSRRVGITMNPERSGSERMVRSKLELVLFMASFSQRATGFKIVKEVKDQNCRIIYFDDGGPIQAIDLGTDEDFILNIDTHQGKIPVEVKYSKYFKSLPLPVSEKFLDNEADEISDAFLNYCMQEIMRKTTEFNELEHGKGSGINHRSNDEDALSYYEMKRFYTQLVTPWFCQKYIPKRIVERLSSSESEEDEEEEIEDVKNKKSNGKSKNNKKEGKKKVEEPLEDYTQGPIIYPDIPSGGKSGALFGIDKGHPFGRLS